MKTQLVGYNRVEYTKNGEDRFFVKAFVQTEKEITYGNEVLSIVCGCKYWDEKIFPAFQSGNEVHVGFDRQKDNKPFLYIKK